MSDHKVSASSDDYIFSRDDRSAIRLNYQHALMNRLCGFRIHPSVPRDIPNLMIADVAAGSALWAEEVVEELPDSTQMYAIDISPDQFPAPHWMPKNVHLMTHDCFKPWPATLLGKFDIVNVRFFLTTLTPDNIPAFLESVKSLLKPGGYFHWFEPDMQTLRVTTGGLPLQTPAINELIPIMQKPTPNSDHSWVSKVDEILTDANFNVTAFDRYPMRNNLIPMFGHTQVMVYEALCEQLEHEGQNEPAIQGRDHIRRLRKEYHDGAALVKDFVCCVARKKDE